MIFHPNEIRLAVELTKDEFKNVIKSESLHDDLMAIEDVVEVGWDGHFGPFIYVNIDIDTNRKFTFILMDARKNIKEVIEKNMK
jgi:hypothetical protein